MHLLSRSAASVEDAPVREGLGAKMLSFTEAKELQLEHRTCKETAGMRRVRNIRQKTKFTNETIMAQLRSEYNAG